MVLEVTPETALSGETTEWKGTLGDKWSGMLVMLFLDLYAGSLGKNSLSCILRFVYFSVCM